MADEIYPDGLSEEIQLYEAWNRMKDLQSRLNFLESSDFTEVHNILNEYQTELWALYSEYSGQKVSISGSNIAVPLLDETDTPSGHTIYKGTVPDAYFSGITVADIDGRFLIGLKATTGQSSDVSLTHERTTTYNVFAPFESTSFTTLDNSIVELLPEDDDEIAQEIDEAILSNPIDLPKLITLLQNIDPSTDEMKIDMYLRHANALSSFQTVTAIATHGFMFDEEDSISAFKPEDGFILSGDFNAFRIAVITTDEGETIPKLLITGFDADGDLMAVMAEDVTEIQLK